MRARRHIDSYLPDVCIDIVLYCRGRLSAATSVHRDVCVTSAEGAGSGSINLGTRSSFLERASSPSEDVLRDVLDGTEALAAFNVVNTVSLKVCIACHGQCALQCKARGPHMRTCHACAG